MSVFVYDATDECSCISKRDIIENNVAHKEFDIESGDSTEEVINYLESLKRQGSFPKAESVEDLYCADMQEILENPAEKLFIGDNSGNIKAEAY